MLRRVLDRGLITTADTWDPAAKPEATLNVFVSWPGLVALGVAQASLDSFLPLCEQRGIGIILGGPYNSGILATGPVPGALYDYAPASPAILERTEAIKATCRRHGVPLRAAALQFPLLHPTVATVIPGARDAAEVEENLRLMTHPIPYALWLELRQAGLIRYQEP